MTETMCYIESIATQRMLPDDLRELIPDAAMRRRMSRIVKQGVATAVACAGGVERIAGLDAIITATGWGCLADSERFLRLDCETQEQMLNPTPFIQSTFNTVGAQVALIGGNHAYNTTYVHRSRSFESALLDAMMRLEEGEASQVLVGAYDEETPTQHRIMERMGCWRRACDGEGCTFVLLTAARTSRSLAKLERLDFPTAPLTPAQCIERYASQPDALLVAPGADDACYPTRSAALFVQGVEAVAQGRPEVVVYNTYFGEEPTVAVLRWVR